MVFMSILGRRPSRDDSGHDGSQGQWRDDRDYGADDNWSPDEYFSPQDIRGTRAAPSRPERDDRFGGPGPARFRGEADDFDGRAADRKRGGDPADSGSFPRAARGGGRRGGRDGEYGRSGDFPTGSYDTGSYDTGSYDTGSYDTYDTGSFDTGSYDTGSYDTGSYDTGSYETGAFDTGGFRTGGYGRDKDDPNGQADGERGGGGRKRRMRIKRRDKGDDIWPEDGVSDEDYWASVAADRPLPGTSSALDADSTQVMGATAIAGSAAASSLAPRPDRPAGPRPGQQYQGGRPALDAAPGAGAPGSKPAPRPGISSGPAGLDSGPMSRVGTPSGPFPRPGATSGPMARPGTGPNAARPAAGLAQPTFSPATSRRGEAQRPNWAAGSERTERFDRIAADGGVRPDRPGGSAGSRRDSRGPDSWGGAPQRPSFEPHGADPQGQTGSWGRAEGPRGTDPGRGSSAPRGRDRMVDSGPQRSGAPGHRSDPPRGSDPMRSAGGARGALTGPQRVRDDDPLTSPLFSREAMAAADTRSYQGARRSQPAAGRPGGAQTGGSMALTGSYPAGADPYAGQSASGWSSYPDPGATSARPADADPYARPGAPAGAGHGGSPLGSNGYDAGYATGSFASSTGRHGTGGYGTGYSSPGYGGADGYSSGGYSTPGYDPASYPAAGREPGGYGNPAGGGLPTGSHGATGGYGTQASGPAGATPYPATGGYMTTGSYPAGGYPADGSLSGSYPGTGYPANGAGSTPAGSTAQPYGAPVYGAPPSPAADPRAGNMPPADGYGYGYEARPDGYENGSAFPRGSHQPPAR
jgi:hypothetical protein